MLVKLTGYAKQGIEVVLEEGGSGLESGVKQEQQEQEQQQER